MTKITEEYLCQSNEAALAINNTLPIFYEYLQTKTENTQKEFALAIFAYDQPSLLEKHPQGFTDGVHLFLSFNKLDITERRLKTADRTNLVAILDSVAAVYAKPGEEKNGIARITTEELISLLSEFPASIEKLSLDEPNNVARILAFAKNDDKAFQEIQATADRYLVGVFQNGNSASPPIFNNGVNATNRALEAATALRLGEIIHQNIVDQTADQEFMKKSASVLAQFNPNYLSAATIKGFRAELVRYAGDGIEPKSALGSSLMNEENKSNEARTAFIDTASRVTLLRAQAALEDTPYDLGSLPKIKSLNPPEETEEHKDFLRAFSPTNKSKNSPKP